MPLNDSARPENLTCSPFITSHHSATLSRQSGVGMIEILVTVLILSIGFLAAAKMQVLGMRFSQSAYMQSQAYFMISDIMDRMRSNRDGVVDGYYNGKSTTSTASNPDCSSKFCSDQQLAQQDLFDWSTNLHPLLGISNFIPLLPGSDSVEARGEIVPKGGGVYLIRVAWSEKTGSEDAEQRLEVEFAP